MTSDIFEKLLPDIVNKTGRDERIPNKKFSDIEHKTKTTLRDCISGVSKACKAKMK